LGNISGKDKENMIKAITYHPIGVIHSSFHEIAEMPIQPTGEASAAGMVEVFAEYSQGLKDLEGFSHLILIYHFHQAGIARLVVTPFLDKQAHGVFATRAPTRPNSLGLSIIALDSIDGNMLKVHNLDILDGTPLLDIKPYVPQFDQPLNVRTGWLEKAKGEVGKQRADDRFK
jgi:tRNA-Thr(GGU) m(6)t(6)A37 methyltransferase TsaA